MRTDPIRSLWLYSVLLPALWWGPGALSVRTLSVAVALTVLTVVLGHTVGLHRGVIHRSFETSQVMRALFVLCFAATGLGGPRRWMILHAVRDHYQSVPDAPEIWRYRHDGSHLGRAMLRDAWWTLHCSAPVPDPVAVGVRREDLVDPVIAWVDRLFFPIQLAIGALSYGLGGWDVLIVAFCGRIALVIVGHWLVGYVSHTSGYRRYRIDSVSEEGFNNWLLGVLSFGEGFHNNHHAAPQCARLGRHWTELDLGWLVISLLESLGLVWAVARPRGMSDLLREGARLLPEVAPAKQPAAHCP